MSLRRNVKPKKKGRLQKVEEASKIVCLQSADSPIIDGETVDDIEDTSISGSSSRGLATEGPSRREQQIEFVEMIIEDVEKKAREWCDAIMDENAQNIRMQQRTRDRVKNKINRKFRHMKLADLCHMSGNDFNAALLMAVPPAERAALLAEAKDGGQETDEEKEDQEEMPTTIKGRNPPRTVAPTPKGGVRQAGREPMTRSAAKGPRASARLSVAREPEQQQAVVAQTPLGRGRAGGRVMRSAVKGKGSSAAVAGSGATSLQLSSTSIEDAPELPKSVIAHLHKRFEPDCTVWQCLDIIFQPKIDGYTRHAEAVCAELRQNIAERSEQLRAKIAPADEVAAGAPGKKKNKKAAVKHKAKGKSKRGAAAAAVAAASADPEGGDVGCESPGAMEVDETGEAVEGAVEEENSGDEEEEEAGGTAKISLKIEGGPYDRQVFEIFLEEDGDARLVGRSTGKKFKNHGISLRRDSEVSITHGMFTNSGGVIAFMDNGSTNGTQVDGKWVTPKKAYEIFPGSELLIGQSHCTVDVTWER